MFKLYKEYIKWKLKSLIKDRMLELSRNMESCTLRRIEWEGKKHDNQSKITEIRFEQIRKEQITFSYDEYKRCYHQYRTTESILAIVDSL